jgi:hypothetical protein
MTVKKKAYEKPMIQDLGRILTGSAQMPMGYCTSGDSPSGAQQECTGGSGVSTACVGGNLFNYPQDVCQAGGVAADYCGFGGSVG